MRLYDVAVASLAIDAPLKWTDNLISQHRVPGVISARRGVARRIPYSTVLYLAVVREIHVRLGIGVRDALRLAGDLLAADADAVHRSGHICVTLDRPALERALMIRLREALESAPAPPRGRPPVRGRRSSLQG